MAELTGPAPVVVAGRYSGSSREYVTLAWWYVGREWGGSRGELSEIRISCTDYAHPRFRLTLKTGVQRYRPFDGLKLEEGLVLRFGPNDVLRVGDEVLLEVRSDDGTAVTCFASITGAEAP
jgi:hypothetical protein